MKASLNSVKGTAFGLNDAAQAAGKLGASIRDTDKMERSLKNVAAAAQISGKDFGHISDIWAKMAGQGKVTAADLTQLSKNGVPAASLLARSMGTTEQAVRQMASNGELDFEKFDTAMNKVLGKAAVDAADTSTGAMKNFGAALGRLGASAIAPMLPGLKELLKHLIDVADAVTAKLQPVFESIGKKFEAFGKGGLSGVTSTLGKFAPIIGAAAGAFGPILTKLPLIGGAFKGITGPIGLAVGIVGKIINPPPRFSPRSVGFSQACPEWAAGSAVFLI